MKNELHTLDEKDLDRFFLLSQDLLAVFAFDGTIKWINPAWKTGLGYSETELSGKNFGGLIHPDDLNLFTTQQQKLSEKDTAVSFDLRVNNSNGESRWIWWNITSYTEQQLFYAVGKDITDRRESEQEARFLQELTEHLNRPLPVSEAIRHTICRILEYSGWNYGQVWLLDSSSREIIRLASCFRSCDAIVGDEDTPEIYNAYSSVSGGPEAQTEQNEQERLMEFDEMNRLYNIFPDNDVISGVLSKRQPVWIENIAKIKNFTRLSWVQRAGLNTLVILPIIYENAIEGVMEFYVEERTVRNERLIRTLSSVALLLGAFVARKRTEENLLRKDKLLDETQKLTHTGSWEWDLLNDRIYWSDELYRIYGLKPQAHQSYRSLLKLLPPGDAKRLQESVQKSLIDRQPYRIEHCITRPDGTTREILWQSEIVTDHSGKAVRVIGTAQDITSKKSYEEALRKSEEYFRSLIENALDIKSILDTNGRFKFVSPSVERMLGYTPEELKGKNVLRFVHRTDVKNVRKAFSEIIDTPGTTVSVEFRIRNKRGGYLNLESIVRNLLHNTAVNGIVINSRDVTARKNAENTIHALLSISKKLNSTLNPDSLLDLLVTEASSLTDSEGGFAALKTFDGMASRKYYHRHQFISYEHFWNENEGIAGYLVKHKQPYISNEPADATVLVENEISEKYSIRSVAAIPIMDMSGEVIGFAEVHNKRGDKGRFTDKDKELLLALSQSASTAFQNALAYQKIKTAEYQLKNSREQLRRLSAHLQSAREEERTRISREIHDELGQALTGLKMDLSWLEKKMASRKSSESEIKEKFSAMSVLIDSTIKVVRKISSELRPGVLDYLGLMAAIEWQAQEFQSRTGIACRLVNINKDIELDQERSTALFRIFQETLTNVTRHANATEVEVSLEETERFIVLVTKDNGRGITENEISNSKSLGILGMRERTLLLGGDFKIAPWPDGGTVVTVSIPLKDENQVGEIL